MTPMPRRRGRRLPFGLWLFLMGFLVADLLGYTLGLVIYILSQLVFFWL